MSDEPDAREEESRSDRLRRRRSQRSSASTQDDSETTPSSKVDSGASTPVESSKPSEPSEQSESSDPVDSESVKAEQVGTYMYLPKSQKKELERLYNVLKAEYTYEYEAEFEKNRHFYPLVVQYGLDSLDGLDASELRDRLESL